MPRWRRCSPWPPTWRRTRARSTSGSPRGWAGASASPPRSFADLRDRAYAYNDPDSHSGYNVPRDHLLRLGETAGYFGRVVASGSHQASIRLVETGEVDASGIDSTVLDLERQRRPDL